LYVRQTCLPHKHINLPRRLGDTENSNLVIPSEARNLLFAAAPSADSEQREDPLSRQHHPIFVIPSEARNLLFASAHLLIPSNARNLLFATAPSGDSEQREDPLSRQHHPNLCHSERSEEPAVRRQILGRTLVGKLS